MNSGRGYYDSSKGWERTNPGWYELILHIDDPWTTVTRYGETLEWIEKNIHGYHKHCRWIYAGNYLKYKFRYEKDYMWFRLVWE